MRPCDNNCWSLKSVQEECRVHSGNAFPMTKAYDRNRWFENGYMIALPMVPKYCIRNMRQETFTSTRNDYKNDLPSLLKFSFVFVHHVCQFSMFHYRNYVVKWYSKWYLKTKLQWNSHLKLFSQADALKSLEYGDTVFKSQWVRYYYILTE